MPKWRAASIRLSGAGWRSRSIVFSCRSTIRSWLRRALFPRDPEQRPGAEPCEDWCPGHELVSALTALTWHFSHSAGRTSSCGQRSGAVVHSRRCARQFSEPNQSLPGPAPHHPQNPYATLISEALSLSQTPPKIPRKTEKRTQRTHSNKYLQYQYLNPEKAARKMWLRAPLQKPDKLAFPPFRCINAHGHQNLAKPSPPNQSRPFFEILH
jgi:hypothetical protein